MLRKILNNKLVKGTANVMFNILSDEQVIKLQYLVTTKRKLNINQPKRFTEKIQWYKLNYQDPIMTQCADKYLVRNYIKQKGYTHSLVKLFQVVDSYDEIDFEKLPNSFVIKSNKGSGTNIFIENKNSMDKEKISKEIESWKNVNTTLYGKEWAYKNIEHKIIIEELLVDSKQKKSKQGIKDYKIMCFQGQAKYIWVDSDRFGSHSRQFYNINWEPINVITDIPTPKNPIAKPEKLSEMIKMAETLSSDFPFARVDLYWVNEQIYFGEITFYPWSGTVRFSPDSFDYELGELFKTDKTIT